jgi:hypothetical protein
MLANVVAQVSSVEQIHNQVEVFSILEGVVHVYEEGVLNLRKNLSFIHDTFDGALRYDSCLAHFFHGVLLLILLAIDSPYSTKTSFSDAVLVRKALLGNSCL